IRPERLVHDMHPDYASTRYAREQAERTGVPCLAVQHHHAHMASCMAENQAAGPVIGVCFDGAGYGPDETVWGGEFLVGGYAEYRRAAHLRNVRLPGGDQAAREPWRMAAAYVHDAGLDATDVVDALSPVALRAVRRMVETGFHSPYTSSAGRLFDA